MVLDADSQLVLCRSAQRRIKEEAMISKAESRFLTDACALRERIEKGRLKNPATIERKIGTLQKKHPRVQRFYKILGIDWERACPAVKSELKATATL